MNSATDTDSTADTRLRFGFDRCNKGSMRNESWREKEKKRLSNILEYNLENWDIDDKGLQSITKLAAIICGMPLSFVTLVGDEKVKFLSRYGCELVGTIRKDSFCDLAIEQYDYFEIEDTLKDVRFVENEFVKGQENPIRFYGAYPLISPKGYNFGSLCVCDLKDNKLNENQKTALKTLTDEVMIHLELRKQNKELTEANELAEKLAKVKDEFVNNVSHELRTPLNAIGGYAEILSKTDLDSDQKEAVSIIKSSCEILITLINDILDFSKIQLGKLQLENIPFDLRKTIKNVKDLLNPKAKEKNLKFDLKIDEKIPKFILGDKVRLNQIIMNLTGNALKFTQEGSVRIDVKLLNETEEKLNLFFKVVDTGIGIPEDKLHTIFERFEQAGKDITRKFGGSGLGLNISKNLVELHNSKLEVKSVFGKGTEFYFTIQFDKLLDNDESRNFVNQKVENNYMEKISKINELKLLVCEDNSVNIKLIKAIFKNKNINIEIAENGKIAIDLLKRKNKKFDLILMDLQMPEMNGFETTKYIRNIMNLNIPIIGFSASTSEIERNYCFELGMNDYILKSFGGNEIFDKLNNFVNANKIYEEDLDKNPNENLNTLGLNKSKLGVSENISNKKPSHSFKLKKKDLKRKFNSKIPGQKEMNKFNNHVETGGLRGVGLMREKNYSNCEKIGIYNISSNSPLTENVSNKDSIDKNNNSNKGSNDINHRSIFSQDVPQLKKYNINFSSDINNATSSKNSSENINKNNFSMNSKKKIFENNQENEMHVYFNEGYYSNTECDFNKKNNILNLSMRPHKISQKRLLNKKDSDQSAKLNLNEFDLNKSFKSESNINKYNNYFKNCISVGLNKASSNSKMISNPNNNNYKFSKFNENLNNKGSSNNNSRCFSERNNVNLFADSSNSNLMHNILCDERLENNENENKDENEDYVEKNLENIGFLENENNFEIISNSSMTSPKIKENLNIKKEEKPNEKEEQAIKENINNEKKMFTRKSSFAKLKDNESLDFSQVSIRFENFDDYSEKENEDLMDIENFNENIFEDNFIDDPEMREELLELFMEENPKQMKSLKSAIIARNLDAIKFVAHTMKPSVLMFGMRKMYKNLVKIEVICKTISLGKIKRLYEDIKKDLEIFYAENKVRKV